MRSRVGGRMCRTMPGKCLLSIRSLVFPLPVRDAGAGQEGGHPMRRFFRAAPLPIFLVAVLIAVVLVGLHSLGSVGHAAAPVKLPPGATAIMPSRPGQVPSFTEADVRAYLAL